MTVSLPSLLALDSATEVLSLGLCTPAGVWSVLEPGGAQSSARLLPRVQAMLAEAGLVAGQLQAVAYGRGPGAFTGLRTACAVAQGLAFGLGLPVLPLDSLMLVAEDAWAQAEAARDGAPPSDWWVAMDARMDEVYAACYRRLPADGDAAHGRWQTLVEPALYTLPALAEVWAAAPPRAVAGSALAAFGPRLPLPAAGRCLPREADRAAALLRLAQAAWAEGRACPAEQALPLYVRDKVAQTTAERLAAKAAAAP